MVSGLFIPLLGAFFWKKSHPVAAFWAMLLGGSTTLYLTIAQYELPFGLDPNIFGITASFLVFVIISLVLQKEKKADS